MNTKRKWMARFIVAANVILACVIAYGGYEGALRGAIDRSGDAGILAVAMLGFVAIFGLVDVLINDILPERFKLQCALKYRHTVYMLMSLGCLSMIFVLVKNHEPTPALLHFGLVAYAALLLAVFDVRDRMKGPIE